MDRRAHLDGDAASAPPWRRRLVPAAVTALLVAGLGACGDGSARSTAVGEPPRDRADLWLEQGDDTADVSFEILRCRRDEHGGESVAFVVEGAGMHPTLGEMKLTVTSTVGDEGRSEAIRLDSVDGALRPWGLSAEVPPGAPAGSAAFFDLQVADDLLAIETSQLDFRSTVGASATVEHGAAPAGIGSVRIRCRLAP